MPSVEILCLANSKKHGGRCVAGLRTDGQGWVRPVTSGGDGALFSQLYTLRDGSEARVLDVLRVDVREPVPRPHQPENWRITGVRWELVARPASETVVPLLRSYLIPGPALLGNCGDRIAFEEFAASPAPASLALVAPRELMWHVVTNPARSRTQLRARFKLAGVVYDLVVTDPVCLQRLGDLPPGLHPPETVGLAPEDAVLLAVSLGEPFEGFCYKLVAGVVALPAAWQVGETQGTARTTGPAANAVPHAGRAALQDRYLAQFVASLGSSLAAHLGDVFEREWESNRLEEDCVKRLRDTMEAVLLERLRETDRP